MLYPCLLSSYDELRIIIMHRTQNSCPHTHPTRAKKQMIWESAQRLCGVGLYLSPTPRGLVVLDNCCYDCTVVTFTRLPLVVINFVQLPTVNSRITLYRVS